ncbi:alpha-E domain-containing protein [Prosthecodimorpha staleyi]|uniref:Alpha-E domain-containing protein n=1 Tax=Prosthecodimorpha staleyi TaxID=2840188 RepID=A0A947D870_9HYPH|nr:alpha-E domain-containing protein [Prosthecodimorpha staleyi]MBT9292178.1 alpha-E domain-containing protein [Prosthecodimorpha staleyi]
MLSRTADSLYWLSRYVERAENTARIIDAASRLAALPAGYGSATNEWESALAATGSKENFAAHYDEATPETVVEFLAFSPQNPSSIKNCLENARTNARSVRTALTTELWETINSAWLELKNYSPRDHNLSRLADFLRFVKQTSLSFDGSAYRTMLRSDSYCFTRIGVYMERADATARILDVKYHVLLPPGAQVGGSLDYFQWSSILRSVSALTAYHWVYRQNLKPWLVADLLILNQQMPRSIASCYENLTRYLDMLARHYGRQGPSQRHARSTFTRLQNANLDDVFQSGLHEFLSEFIADNNRLGSQINEQYLI